jgi:hypothetical protein
MFGGVFGRRFRPSLLAAVLCVLSGNSPATYAGEVSGKSASGGVSFATARELIESDLAPLSSRAIGVPIGAFVLTSSVDLEATYDDNVFADPADERDDISYRVAPRLHAVSNWSVHRLEFEIGGEGDLHQDFSSENEASFYTGLGGLLEVRDDFHVNAYARYELDQEERGEGESFAGFDDPIEFQKFMAGLSVNKRFNRLWFNVGGAVRHDDFEDTSLGGATVDQDFRDGDFYTLTVQSGFDLSPITSFYGEYSYKISDYQGEQFDSDGQEVLAGVKYELTELVSLDVAGGFLTEGFDGSGISDIDEYSYRAKMSWIPTELLTVGLVGRRYVGVSNFSGPTNTVSSEIAVKGAYALRYNLVVRAGFAYEDIDYTSISRDDDVWKVLTSAKYDINANLALTAGYEYTQYDSNVAGIPYERNEARLGISARY